MTIFSIQVNPRTYNVEVITYCLADKESQEIFKARLLYSLTGDFDEVRKLIETTGAAKEIHRRVSLYPEKEVVIWGTGFWGTAIKEAFPDFKWKCYVDNNPKVDVKNELPVYSADSFLRTIVTS